MVAIRPGAPASPIRFSHRIRADRRGVTAVEFGFIVMPLMALLVATLQIATTMFTQQALETVAEKGARLLLTGQPQKAGMSAATFRTAMCGTLPGYMKCDKLMIDVAVANDFSSAVTTMPTITYDSSGKPNNSWSYNAGNPGDIIVMRTMYVWDVQKGPLGFDIANLTANRRLLIATSVFRAENY